MNVGGLRILRSVGAVSAIGCVLLSGLLMGSAPGASAADDGSVTKTGSGRFSDLKVTVSQVQHLRNVVVRVSWTGGDQSTTSGANFFNNYLQIMQCWGDEDAPQREKCQYGGIFDDQRGGQATSSREIVNNGQLDDPNETYHASFPASAVVPFKSVTGKTVTDKRNEFFDSQSTNEIDYGRTSADGTGEEFFEVETTREAPGLGCGALEDDGSPRDCWLVVVPRDSQEVNGQDVSQLPANRLETSPLSATNFANAISFRLEFDQVGVTCPIGSPERRVLGNESVGEAVGRWQPKLCDETGAIFGYSQLGDSTARSQTLSSDPWISLVNRPLPADQNTDGRMITYAPVAVNAVGIGVVIERVPKDGQYDPANGTGSTDAEKAKRGTRVLDLKLNARLVAKLLTQTYTAAVTGDLKHVDGNPRWLTEDQEFLSLNPEFKQLSYIGRLYSITNPLGLADANRSLWEWIKSDPDAVAFINGKKDQWGTRVNPFYKGMNLDIEDFPRSDSTCVTFPASANQADFCALDHLAYAADFHAATRGAIRGQTLANDTWDVNPPQRYKQTPPQTPGQRAVLVVTDTATAARFKVGMAQLENASGHFVAPNKQGMTAGLAAMKSSGVPGVLAANPASKSAGAYPLTEITYAMTAPRELDKNEAADYAGFVKYVSGIAGQTPGISPGQLPDGYLPLTSKLRAQAARAAALIAKRGGPVPATSETETPTGAPTGADGSVVPAPGAAINGVVKPGAVAGPVTPAVISPASFRTQEVRTGATRYVLLIALLLGILTLAVKPATLGYAVLQKYLAGTSGSGPGSAPPSTR